MEPVYKPKDVNKIIDYLHTVFRLKERQTKGDFFQSRTKAETTGEANAAYHARTLFSFMLSQHGEDSAVYFALNRIKNKKADAYRLLQEKKEKHHKEIIELESEFKYTMKIYEVIKGKRPLEDIEEDSQDKNQAWEMFGEDKIKT